MSSPEVQVSRGHSENRALNQAFLVVSYDKDGRIQSANNQFLRIMGYELAEIAGLDLSMFFSSSADRSQRADIWRKVAGGESHREITLWIAKHGKEVWLESRFLPILDDAGDVSAIVQIGEDVSATLQREAEQQAQVEAIQTTQAVIHFALDGTILSVNDRFLAAVGYSHDEVVGQHHSMFVDPGHSGSEEYKAFWAELAAGQHHAGEFRRTRKNGSEVWLQAVYTPIFDPAGRPTKIVKYAADITEEKLRQADYQWQVNAIRRSNCTITFDMNGTILDANDLFLEATGYAIEEIRGRHHKMFVEPSHAYGTEYLGFWNDLRAGKHRAGQFKRYGKDGREIWLQATYNPIFDAGGKPVKVVKYASIVTDERLLQVEHQGQIAAIHNSHCVIAFDLDGTILDANENFLDLMGYRFAQVCGQHHRMFVEPGHDESPEYKKFWAGLAEGRYQGGEFKRIGCDGREVWLQATYNPIRDMNGRVFKIVQYATDVTGEKLQQADYQGQITAINKSQNVVVFALDGTILEANDNFLETLGYQRSELVGHHHSMLLERAAVASREYAEFWDKLKRGEFHSGMYKRLGKGGKEVWIQASYNPILDLNGKPIKVIKYATDVSANVALAEAFDEAKRQAQHDSATSLPNRNKLASFMDACLADPAASMAVFYIDLDRFKPINDLHGHHIGDRVLGEVADRLRRTLRDEQMVARVGGDEFVIAAPGMQVDAVERFCKKLYAQVAAPIRYDDSEIAIGMSVGIAIAPADGKTPDDLLRAADAALYRSKQNGRGIFSYYSSELNEKINGQRQLIEEMRNSFTAGDFYLEYQPRFDTREQTVRSVEALVRWAHPERGRISPADFIPLAEQCGLIVPLGEWILKTACQTVARWDDIGVSVNVSPVQFRDASLIEKVSRALAESGLAAERLELEITEGVLLDDADRAVAMLGELKALGVKLAIDDFGTGYSSLSYLRNFPFDVIKIDRSFVKDLETGDGARPVVQAILALGRALGLSVTAEGVETAEQLVLLTTDQCGEVQGFLMSHPLKADELETFLAAASEERTPERSQRNAA